MPRPRTGSLYWTKSGWRARLTVEVDGEHVQRSFDLQTTSRAAAKLKLKRLVEESAPVEALQQEAARVETFSEAAQSVVAESKIASKSNREGRLRIPVLPHLGTKLVTEVTASDVREVLKHVADQGLSRDLVTHVKNDIGAVLGELWCDEAIPENVVSRVRVPDAKVHKRERAVLTDDELVQYLGWQHPG